MIVPLVAPGGPSTQTTDGTTSSATPLVSELPTLDKFPHRDPRKLFHRLGFKILQNVQYLDQDITFLNADGDNIPFEDVVNRILPGHFVKLTVKVC